MRKAIVVVAVVALLVAACGRVPRADAQPGDQILYVAVGATVAAIDAATHASIAQLPQGVASADWKHYYTVTGDVLTDLNPMTGVASRSLPLPAAYSLPVVTATGATGGLSQNGQYLVLQGANNGASHLLLVDTSFTKPPVRIDDLRGDFQFDAVSLDGTRIYLIEHTGDGHYFVRDYVLGSGLDPTIIFDKSDGTLAMSGERLMGVPAPAGDMLYSVYARKDKSAFVHQLFLDGPIAICIDLSGPGYGADARAMRWSLAMAPDGSRLFATNPSLGIITEISLDNSGSRTVPLDGGSMRASAGTLVTPDGRWLIVAGTGIRWLDANTLRMTASALPSWNIVGLANSADGKAIYAISDSGQIAQLDGAGRTVTTFDSATAHPGGLLGSAFFS
jgi:hypothetical protein